MEDLEDSVSGWIDAPPPQEQPTQPHAVAAAAARAAADVPANRSSMDDEGPLVPTICRYCLDEEPADDIIFPCKCTTGVHCRCLGEWLTSSERAAERGLRCELCAAQFSASLTVPPIWYLFTRKSGRTILLKFALRLTYRILLIRRMGQQYSRVVREWRDLLRLRTRIRKPMQFLAFYRDTLVCLLVGWLCCTLLSRDVKSFLASSRSFRQANARLTFYDRARQPRCYFV